MPRPGPLISAALRRKPRAGAAGKPAPRREHPRVTSGSYAFAPIDAWRQKRPPTPAELIASFRLVAYACADIQADALACTPLRLYATTSTRLGQKKARWGIGRPISKATFKRFGTDPVWSKKVRASDYVEEIVDHPILDSLDWVNPWMDRYTLLSVQQLYLETVGWNFWTFSTGGPNGITEIWPLPAWMVRPQLDYNADKVVDRYVFTGGGRQTIYPPEDVVMMHNTNLYDPYTQPWSPLRAAYELCQVYDKRTDAEDSWLNNVVRPGAAFVPGDDVPYSPDEITRLSLQFSESFSRVGTGGLAMLPVKGQITPLSWSNTDPSQEQAKLLMRRDICTIFRVPVQLFEGTEGNRANVDGGLLQLARFGTRPRVRRMEQALNSNILPRFVPEADQNRLFLAFDDPVPADEIRERDTHKAYIDMGVMTRNAVAEEKGEPTFMGGDEILIPNNLVKLADVINPPEPPVVRPEATPTPEEETVDVDGAKEGVAARAQAEEDDEEFEEGQDVKVSRGMRPALVRALKSPNGNGRHWTVAEALEALGRSERALMDDPDFDPEAALTLVESINKSFSVNGNGTAH